MRIGVLTYFIGQNYGALLQAYATMVALRQLGHEVVFIHYHQPWSKGPSFFSLSSYLSLSPCRMAAKWKRLWFRIWVRPRFVEMERRFPKTARYYRSSIGMLRRHPPCCDVYLVGSDQIWSCAGGLEHYEAYFLTFGFDSVRRVSYASSLGGARYSGAVAGKVVEYLSRFSAVSVRERSSVSYLRQLGVRSPVWVPDPTLLLKAGDYADLTATARIQPAEAFVYILKDGGREMQACVQACMQGYATILNVPLDGFKVPDGRNRILTVPQFIRALSQARIVVTTSFHCTVFAILFHRPFVTLRLSGEHARMNDRLTSLLTDLGLMSRLVSASESVHLPALLREPIDWAAADSRMEVLRRQGWDFLEQALAADKVEEACPGRRRSAC